MLAVVASHLGGQFGNGGYIGVELFFVLSGFLITRLLLLEMQSAETVDLLAFYARRALLTFPGHGYGPRAADRRGTGGTR